MLVGTSIIIILYTNLIYDVSESTCGEETGDDNNSEGQIGEKGCSLSGFSLQQ